MTLDDWQFVAIAGATGSGKSTLAEILAKELGANVISTGDVARKLDPGAMSRGDLADENLMAVSLAALLQTQDGRTILDGMPRTYSQVELLPAGTVGILLTCRPDVARHRLMFRGRPDDTEDLIDKRLTEQRKLLELDMGGGWAYRFAGWHGAVNTTYKLPEKVAAGVVAYLTGAKREAF